MSGGKPCDSCKTSGSLVFCLSDSAALCLTCDARIHAPPAPPHARVWMCEVCELSPASLTCKADDAVLCATCDSDIHSANPLALRHERVPLVPFLDCRPARSNGILHAHVNPSDGLDEDDKCNDEDDELETTAWLGAEGQDLKLFAGVDPYLDLDYSASMDGGYGTTSDSVVPVQDRPLLQPQHLMPPSSADNSNSILELDFSRRPKASDHGYTTLSHSVSSSSLDVGVVPDGNNSAMADISNPFGLNTKLGIEFSTTGTHQTTQVLSQDREARVLRYREKRKNRKFEKTIRYASRKAYAEVRPRIKGRFAKRTESTVEIEGIYAPPSSVLMADAGYGVVPTF